MTKCLCHYEVFEETIRHDISQDCIIHNPNLRKLTDSENG